VKKLFLIISIVLMICCNYDIAYAKYIIDENGNLSLSADSYTADGKIKISSFWDNQQDTVLNAEINKIDWAIPKLAFNGADGATVTGKMSYKNYSEQTVGNFDLQWEFKPDDSKYEVKTGVFHFYLWPHDTEEQKGKMPTEEITEEITTPSLTATSVQLNSLTTYDINLDNKISGSTYQWTSSDTDVVEVNSKSGLLKARKEGKATITCKVTTPDSETYNLTSNVTVGYDDNAPVLTETNLDLSVGDTYDINLENKVAKSKFRWASSDRSIVKVNSATGKIKAVADGNAFVTCTITTPDNQVIVLRCDINVAE
jgi:hypothetical protein